jgi:predicted ATPase
VRIGVFGGLRVDNDGAPISVSGAMQLAVFFRLAVDAGTSVSYRSIVEDVWGLDAPENERAALQSVISRLRSQLPDGAIESTAGGYRLAVRREDVDALRFFDLVATASATDGPQQKHYASEALGLWVGEPWVPSQQFDWFERDLLSDRAKALELGGSASIAIQTSISRPLTSLVGRASELGQVGSQLASSRLVTIVGTGGAGKTRLAVEAAIGERSALLVELAPVDHGEVLSAVLAATGREIRTVETPSSESMSNREKLLDVLSGRDVLLVLDNCEHVIDEVAQLVADLLGALPRLRILTTSREPLVVPGEAFVAVGSLPRDSALELFSQRAIAARGSVIDESEVVHAAAICARLDNLPLAIELAAAKLRTMTPAEILDGLEDRFTLLTGGYRTALPRHQTLRAMIDWSWSLLSEEEKLTLARIAVFPAGVSVAEAAQLEKALGVTSPGVFDSLVDRSLLQRHQGRFRALETIREYGIERLAQANELSAARDLQASHQTERAEHFDSLMRGPRIHEAIEWFDAEDDNISAALRYAVATPAPELAVRLTVASAWYWIIRDRQDDATVWIPQVVPLAVGVAGDAARILSLLGPVLAEIGGTMADHVEPDLEFDRGMTMLAPIAELAPHAGSHDVVQLLPRALSAFTAVAGSSDWMTRARLPLGEELGLDPWPTAALHVARAAMAQNRGDIAELGTASEAAVQQFTAIGDLWGLALSQQMRSEWVALNGDLEEALALSEQSTENMRRITSGTDLAQQQSLAVTLLLRLGRVDDAHERVSALLANAAAGENSRVVLQVHLIALGVDLELGDLESAVSRLADIDGLGDAWPGQPLQLSAQKYAMTAGVRILQGDLDDADRLLRLATDAAIRSHDHPVIGFVALGIGSLALARGDVQRAVDALELSIAFIGACDTRNPRIMAIERAAADAGIGRASEKTLTRPMAVEALRRLAEA